MIHCIYWQDCSMPGGGCCTMGLFRGKVRYDICNKVCTQRVDGEPGSPIPAPAPRPKGGVGTELKRALAFFGLKPLTGCACNARASLLDRQGPEWVSANIETVVDWLEEEAKRRGAFFTRLLGRIIVRYALFKAGASCEVPAIHK